MTPEIRFLAPQVLGCRTIVPVIRETSFCHDHGIIASVSPIALFIGEEGSWGVALLEDGSVTDLLDKIGITGCCPAHSSGDRADLP